MAPEPGPTRRSHWRGSFPTCLFAFSFCLYLSTWHGKFRGYEDETAAGAVAMLEGRYEMKQAGPGAAVLYLPFVCLFRLFDEEVQRPRLTLVPLFYSALTVVVIYAIALLCFERRSVSLATAMLVAVGSIIWPYSNLGMEYQAMLLVSVLLLTLLRWQKRSASLLWPGLTFAWLAVTKTYGILFALPIIGFVSATLWVRSRRWQGSFHPRVLIPLFAPAMVAYATYFWLNHQAFGSVTGLYRLSHEFEVSHWWEGMYGIFFSAGKSIFLYCPLLMISLVYLKRWARTELPAFTFILLGFLMLLLVTAPFRYWSDESWGVRKLVPIIPLLHLPIGYLLLRRSPVFWRPQGLLLAALIIVAIPIQVVGALYTNGKHLVVLRQANMDSLERFRFIPALSQVAVNWHLLRSYLSRTPKTFEYEELSWFRWLMSDEDDVAFVDAYVPLGPYHTPDVIWIARPTAGRRVIASLILLTIAASGIWLAILYSRARELERQEVEAKVGTVAITAPGA